MVQMMFVFSFLYTHTFITLGQALSACFLNFGKVPEVGSLLNSTLLMGLLGSQSS